MQYSATVQSQLFHKLLLQHKELTDEYQRVKTELEKNHKDYIPIAELESQIQERNEMHHVQLQHEQEEVTRLKAELEKTQRRNAELEKTLAEEKQHREDEAQKHQELLSDTETRGYPSLSGSTPKWIVSFSYLHFFASTDIAGRPVL